MNEANQLLNTKMIIKVRSLYFGSKLKKSLSGNDFLGSPTIKLKSLASIPNTITSEVPAKIAIGTREKNCFFLAFGRKEKIIFK